MIEHVLTWMILQDPTLVGLISDRVYPENAPQGAPLPYIVYTLVSAPQTRHQLGDSGLKGPTFQYACVAQYYNDALDLERALIDALNDKRGTFGDTGAQMFIERIALQSQRDGVYEYPDGSDERIRERLIDFEVWHQE